MRARAQRAALTVAAILLTGGVYALIVRAAGGGIPCVFRLTTGLRCPGCGVTHMLLSLLRLDFAAAFRQNAALLCLSPALLALAAVWGIRYVRYGTHSLGKPAQICAWVLIGLLLAWGMVRNLTGL